MTAQRETATGLERRARVLRRRCAMLSLWCFGTGCVVKGGLPTDWWTYIGATLVGTQGGLWLARWDEADG